jgi:NhaA family Na+:H+ antiporter
MANTETTVGGELTPPVGPDDHARGPANAPATVVVYGDYQCPYTRRALTTLNHLERRIGDRFRLVYRHFPLREIHPQAQASAELAEAAADQDKFWEVNDHLFAHQGALEPYNLASYAAEFGIPSEGSDPGTFEAGHRYVERVEDDLQGGLRSGVRGTPTIFINGRPQRGYDEATLERSIELAR